MTTLQEKQASCFLNDAEEYRTINHRIDDIGLKIYNFLYSKFWSIFLLISIVCLHCLAFLEFPSSLSTSSYRNIDVSYVNRANVSSLITFSSEAFFLGIILFDAIFQLYLFGINESKKNPWLLGVFVLMFISWIDLFVSLALKDLYVFRLRRFFRPFFAMQKSQLMKKVLKSLSKTFANIFSTFILLFLWLVTFTLIAVSIFNGFDDGGFDVNFRSFYGAFYTLMVLLTTANNPDAMLKVYNAYRLAFIFFLIFMSIGIFVFMNVLTAIVFDEFKSHVLDSMQTSLTRRRVATKAVFKILCQNEDEVNIDTLKKVIKNSSICKWRKQEIIKVADSLGSNKLDWHNFKMVMQCLDEHKECKMSLSVPKYKNEFLNKCQKFFLSKIFQIIGLGICFTNLVVIAIEVSYKFENVTFQAKLFEATAWIFIIFYVIEMVGKYFAMGCKRFFSKNGCRYDFLITVIILIIKIVETIVLFKITRNYYIFWRISVWDLPRITNLLILARALRIVLLFPSVTPIINTLFDIPFRMKSVIGLLMLFFYVYALLGMNLFGNKINSKFFNKTQACGTYQQLDYGGINFDDFYSSLVVLWCLLIVNNWHAFMEAFENVYDSKFVHIYMISWWIITVIVVMNCMLAFVIETYTHRKSHYEKERVHFRQPKTVNDAYESHMHYLKSDAINNTEFTFQMLFQKDLLEPTEDDLSSSLRKCTFLCKQYQHITQ